VTFVNRLTPYRVAQLIKARKVGRHSDGRGLALLITKDGSQRWSLRYKAPDGRSREAGLGSASSVDLFAARAKADAARAQLAQGRDPLATAVSAPVPTFGTVAEELVTVLEPGFSHPKSAWQWRQSFNAYSKALSAFPVDKVGVGEVMGVLLPLWTTRPATAARLRRRIARVIDRAVALGHRPHGPNPAEWAGNLDARLSRHSKRDRTNYAAMEFEAVPELMRRLEAEQGVSADALRFLILTAARTNEVRLATWGEIDFEKRVWSLPGPRAKNGRAIKIPLCEEAFAILERRRGQGAWIFPGDGKPDQPFHAALLVRYLRRLGVGVTVHGFRSSFRDWCAASHVSFEVAEAALNHVVGNTTTQAYLRHDLFAQRAAVMERWGAFLRGKVVPLVRKPA
jgi:integrase